MIDVEVYGGPHDGRVIQHNYSASYIVFVDEERMHPTSYKAEADPEVLAAGPPLVRCPIRRYSDGRYRVLWSERIR